MNILEKSQRNMCEMSLMMPNRFAKSDNLKRAVSMKKLGKKKCDDMCSIDVMLIDDN